MVDFMFIKIMVDYIFIISIIVIACHINVV